jgi:putative ABC transport system ATP-binding protein
MSTNALGNSADIASERGSRDGVAVRLVDVHKTYPGHPPVPVLRGVSLGFAAGSLTAVMGPSGSGKSTLLHVAAGLDRATRGNVVVGGQDTGGLSADGLTRFRRDHIGFVFQAYNLIGHLDVLANIDLPLLLAGRTPDSAWRAELVETLGLTGLEHRLPGELSGGQAQRVAIARALVTRPTVVFADEPTGALDSVTGGQVLAVLRDTARRFGQTVVLVTHDSGVAAAAERVILLADGTVADDLRAPSAAQIAERMLALGR